jgi:hypothetical protein
MDIAKLNKVVLAFVAIAFVVIALVRPASMSAQVVGASLSGVVSDPQGAPIPNADVAIKNTATGIVTNTKTNTQGLYNATNLLPGTYSITYSYTGFASEIQSDVTLTVGANATINAQLKVGNVTEIVQVTGGVPNIELTSSSISSSVAGDTVRELPLNGRSWSDLVILSPGVNHITTQQPLATGGQNRGNRGFGDNYSINGARPGQSNYRMDGISMNDYANSGPGSALGGNLGVDAIEEFSVITTNYAAEYGKTSGGVVNAISRSGTNQIHGSVYGFFRNDALDARNYFDPPKIPAFTRDQFGASIGAPIRKDKTFIFGDYESVRQNQAATSLTFVPTAAARAGHLCSSPSTPTSCTPSTVTVDPVVAKFLGLYPLPNLANVPSANGDQGQLLISNQLNVDENFFTLRADNKFSEKDSLFGSWLFDRTPFTVPDAFDTVVNTDFTFRQLFIVEETHSFSPHLLNTFRLGYNFEQSEANFPDHAVNPLANDPSIGAIPGGAAPGVTIGGGYTAYLGGLATNNAVRAHWNSYQLYDDAFYSRGKHTFKFGGSVEDMRMGLMNGLNRGKYSFSNMSDFLTNQPNNYQGVAPTNTKAYGDFRQALFGLYLQDDWKARPNLTVNLGIRYEPLTTFMDAQGRVSFLYSVSQAAPHVGNPAYGNSTLTNFSPRIGFAYDPFNDGKTSVRAAFGLFEALPLIYQWALRQVTVAPQGFSATATDRAQLAGTFPGNSFPQLTKSALTAEATNQNPKPSYVAQWNLSLQRQLTKKTSAILTYVGSSSEHLPVATESVNLVVPIFVQGRYVSPNPIGSGKVVNPNFGKITGQFYEGHAHYHALLAGISQDVTRGLSFHGSFTYGKSLDDGSNVGFGDQFTNANPSIPFFDRKRLGTGPSDFNVGKILVVNALYAFPDINSGNRLLGLIAKGWSTSLIYQLDDGLPFTPTFGFGGDPLGSKSSTPIDEPDQLYTPDCRKLTNPGSKTNYIKTQCFTLPTAPDMAFWTTYCDHTSKVYGASKTVTPFPYCFNLQGNASRNALQGPGLQNVDLSFIKNTRIRRISEASNLQLRAEIFNILNHSNFAPPLTSVGTANIFTTTGAADATGGILTSTITQARQIQLAVKFTW